MRSTEVVVSERSRERNVGLDNDGKVAVFIVPVSSPEYITLNKILEREQIMIDKFEQLTLEEKLSVLAFVEEILCSRESEPSRPQ